MAADRDLDLALMRLAWRVDDLDKWRQQVDSTLGKLDQRVGDLSKADEIADAVAAKVKSERTLQLTFVQKAAAFVVGAVAVAGSIKALVGL